MSTQLLDLYNRLGKSQVQKSFKKYQHIYQEMAYDINDVKQEILILIHELQHKRDDYIDKAIRNHLYDLIKNHLDYTTTNVVDQNKVQYKIVYKSYTVYCKTCKKVNKHKNKQCSICGSLTNDKIQKVRLPDDVIEQENFIENNLDLSQVQETESFSDMMDLIRDLLDPTELALIEDKFFNHLTDEQMAKQLGITHQAVNLRLQKVIKKLRVQLPRECF